MGQTCNSNREIRTNRGGYCDCESDGGFQMAGSIGLAVRSVRYHGEASGCDRKITQEREALRAACKIQQGKENCVLSCYPDRGNHRHQERGAVVEQHKVWVEDLGCGEALSWLERGSVIVQ